MKIHQSLLVLLVSTSMIFTGCKKKAENETTAADAEAAAAVTEESIKYAAIPGESVIEWKGSKPTGFHTGTVAVESGVVTVKGDALESGSFLINMNSITVTDLKAGDGKEDLEAHLKGSKKEDQDHFFNVATYPTGAFEVTGVSQSEGKTMLEGNLTLKGVKKNISFPVSIDYEGDTMTLTSEPFTINRTLWNVNYASKSIFSDLGDKFVNDDIELTVKVKAKKA